MDIDILFADADESLRELYQHYFSRQGLAVQTAADGLTCLAGLRSTIPRFLIIDVDLLWGGGDGVLSLMVEDMATSHTPIVFATGDGTPAQLSELTGLPALRCLTKPYSFIALLDGMRAAESLTSDSHALVGIGANSSAVEIVTADEGS